MLKKINGSILLFFMTCTSSVFGDTNRVYHPYVEQHEREIEYGFVLRDAGDKNILLNRAGVGYTWTDKFFSEIYLLTESITHDNQQTRGYEAEFKWQLTEQGEYWADWGLQIEVGDGKDIDSHEIAVGLLWEKEIDDRWITTANFFVEYESGGDVKNEFEGAFRGQLRYRNSAEFDPALEVYLDDKDWAMGPAFMGKVSLGGKKQLRWELGFLVGLDSQTPDTSIRGGLEFEF